jgi:hypothetical protein
MSTTRLTSLDSSFLAVESPTAHMSSIVGAVYRRGDRGTDRAELGRSGPVGRAAGSPAWLRGEYGGDRHALTLGEAAERHGFV